MRATYILTVLVLGLGLANVADCIYSCSQTGFTVSSSGNWCYTYIRFSATWPDAMTYCHIHGAQMVSLDTAANQADVEAFMISDGHVATRLLWTRAYDVMEEGSWIWWGPTSMTYTNWNTGHPSNATNQYNCMVFRAGNPDYTWEDTYCDNSKEYICQYAADAVY